MKVAHLVHPFVAAPGSDLSVAQPIAFESMSIARKFAEATVAVDLYEIQYGDEPRLPMPSLFRRLPDLTRSIAGIKSFRMPRKLALIGDLLDSLFAGAMDADFLVYSNVDICLQPYFYCAIARFIEGGYDAFVINRRTLSDRYGSIRELPFMYAEIGEPHLGYDCFVFRRTAYPRFRLGTMCIGAPWVGRALLANMACHAARFREFRDEHLTFHIGNSRPWHRDEYRDYARENHREYLRIFSDLEAEKGGFSPAWRSYLLDTGDRRQFPDFS